MTSNIRTSKDYRRALNEIEQLMGVTHDSPEGRRFDALVAAVEAWEREHFPLDPYR